MVRGVAANGLGQLKAKGAVADLFLALDHRVNEASVSIGMLCSAQECEQLGTRIGKIPFDVVSSGIEQALFRADVADDTKIKLVGRIRELGTQEANKFLKETLKKWPQSGSARVKQAVDQAVQRDGRWLVKRIVVIGSSPRGVRRWADAPESLRDGLGRRRREIDRGGASAHRRGEAGDRRGRRGRRRRQQRQGRRRSARGRCNVDVRARGRRAPDDRGKRRRR